MSDEITEAADASQIGALLESLDSGDAMQEADESLSELLEAVEATGKKGSITIKVEVERKRPGQVVVRHQIKPVIP